MSGPKINQKFLSSKKWFSKNLLTIKINKTKVTMSKPFYLGLLISDISKITLHHYCFSYTNPEYGDNATLYYTDTESFIVHVKSNDLYADLAGDVETIFGTSNYEVQRLLPKTKKVIGPMKVNLVEE